MNKKGDKIKTIVYSCVSQGDKRPDCSPHCILVLYFGTQFIKHKHIYKIRVDPPMMSKSVIPKDLNFIRTDKTLFFCCMFYCLD